jgi:hypothetical protein
MFELNSTLSCGLKNDFASASIHIHGLGEIYKGQDTAFVHTSCQNYAITFALS